MDTAAPMIRMPSEKEMLKDIWLKLPVLDKLSEKMDKLGERVDGIEEKIASLEVQNQDMESGVSNLEMDVEEIKGSLATKAGTSEITEVKRLIVDLVNRNKRNNVVLHNVPEGAEGSNIDCTGLVHTFLRDTMGIPQAMEIERAHRTPMTSRPGTSDANAKPRPIHVRFLRYRDREVMLKTSTQKRNLEIRGKRIFISDDVHKDTREQHRRLMKKVKEMREKGNFAFIPWSVPRVIKYKEGGKDVAGVLKTMRDPNDLK